VSADAGPAPLHHLRLELGRERPSATRLLPVHGLDDEHPSARGITLIVDVLEPEESPSSGRASFQLSESRCSWEEGECLDVDWPHDIEVALLQRSYFSELQAFRDGDHGGIDDAERKIDVGIDKPGHALDVLVL
jgi:hypothetical protein